MPGFLVAMDVDAPNHRVDPSKRLSWSLAKAHEKPLWQSSRDNPFAYTAFIDPSKPEEETPELREKITQHNTDLAVDEYYEKVCQLHVASDNRTSSVLTGVPEEDLDRDECALDDTLNHASLGGASGATFLEPSTDLKHCVTDSVAIGQTESLLRSSQEYQHHMRYLSSTAADRAQHSYPQSRLLPPKFDFVDCVEDGNEDTDGEVHAKGLPLDRRGSVMSIDDGEISNSAYQRTSHPETSAEVSHLRSTRKIPPSVPFTSASVFGPDYSFVQSRSTRAPIAPMMMPTEGNLESPTIYTAVPPSTEGHPGRSEQTRSIDKVAPMAPMVAPTASMIAPTAPMLPSQAAHTSPMKIPTTEPSTESLGNLTLASTDTSNSAIQPSADVEMADAGSSDTDTPESGDVAASSQESQTSSANLLKLAERVEKQRRHGREMGEGQIDRARDPRRR